MANATEQGPVRHQERNNLMFLSFSTSGRCRMIVEKPRPSWLQLNKRETKNSRKPHMIMNVRCMYGVVPTNVCTLNVWLVRMAISLTDSRVLFGWEYMVLRLPLFVLIRSGVKYLEMRKKMYLLTGLQNVGWFLLI